jgi:hypothetical protein
VIRRYCGLERCGADAYIAGRVELDEAFVGVIPPNCVALIAVFAVAAVTLGRQRWMGWLTGERTVEGRGCLSTQADQERAEPSKHFRNRHRLNTPYLHQELVTVASVCPCHIHTGTV